MKSFSELLDMQTRGEFKGPDANNAVTQKRRKLGASIIGKANGKKEVAYNLAMQALENYTPRLQEFVLSHGEEPAPNLNDLVQQVYELRMKEAAESADILSINPAQGMLFLEQQESDFYDDSGYIGDDFLGEMWAPIEIAYGHIAKGAYDPDGFVDPALVSGIINTVGTKVNAATLKRAAQGKKPGILGFLSTGGKAHYNGLIAYFTANPKVALQVINGEITDESMLPGWKVAPVQPPSNPLVDAGNKIAGDKIKQALPYLIIGFVIILAVIYFTARASKK